MYNNLYINWTKENEIGIKIIDEQHRGIISTINSLYYFIQTGQKKEIIVPTISALKQYIKIHFQTEEALMLEADYPDLEHHIKLHENWTQEAEKVFDKVLSEKDSALLLKFLKDWWIKHIQNEDIKYTSYIKKILPK